MNVTFENLINVWDAQIPNLLVELISVPLKWDELNN